MRRETVKVKVGKYLKPIDLIYDGTGRIFVKFGFNRVMIDEVKSMSKYKWHGFDPEPRKIWSVQDDERTRFCLDFLRVDKPSPYARFDVEIPPFVSERPIFAHQGEMASHALTVRRSIWAAEMGTGKTLAFIEAAEKSLYRGPEIWYIGPKAGVRVVKKEIYKWNATFWPQMFTYEKLVSFLKTYSGQAPRILCFDESQKIKTPTAQRSKAAMHAADSLRAEWGWDSIIILMTGTPAPRQPVDWWHQAEVAQPGYLKEGNHALFKRRLCITQQRESMSGGMYPHFVTWLDDDNKCQHCGKLMMEEEHLLGQCTFTRSVNEIEKLHRRLQGITLVYFKKDVLAELPDKEYDIINVKPSPSTLRVAKLIKKTGKNALTIMAQLRELSDGFQYRETPDGKEECPLCKGTGTYETQVPVDEGYDVDSPTPNTEEQEFKTEIITCPTCGGEKEVTKYVRTVEEIDCPKDEIFIQILDTVEDVGRCIAWAGFTESVNRLVRVAHQQGWAVLRIDGRGYAATDCEGNIKNDDEFLTAMDRSDPRFRELLEKYPKICVCGNPEAGGVALTLTGSPVGFYFSNSHKGEARPQSEDRGHRPGMDENKGYKIIDVFHLGTDKLAYDNLKEKKRLENITMGDIEKALEDEIVLPDYEGDKNGRS